MLTNKVAYLSKVNLPDFRSNAPPATPGVRVQEHKRRAIPGQKESP